MRRLLFTSFALLISNTVASAHFVFLVPDSDSVVKAIFSDSLSPDKNVSIDKIDNSKVWSVDETGKATELKWTIDKDGGFYKIEVPGTGTRMVAVNTDYGILQRGDSKPFWLNYYSKTLVGGAPSGDKASLGGKVPVEIVPLVEGGKIRFVARVNGKPAPKLEVSVTVPGAEKAETLTTDEKGTTQSFDKPGRYAVRFRHVETKSGEEKGKKYDEVRSYATLIVDLK